MSRRAILPALFFATGLFAGQNFISPNYFSNPEDTLLGIESGQKEDGLRKKGTSLEKKMINEEQSDGPRKLAGLSCFKYKGPSDKVAQEMVYWSDVPSDSKCTSPFKSEDGEDAHYITFDPDLGGWNNVRMPLETTVALALAMGRTLVLPPDVPITHLKKGRNMGTVYFNLSYFYDFDAIHSELEGLDIISMEEFLEKEAMTGKLKDKKTGKVAFPPANKTDWNGKNKQGGHRNELLNDWLEKVAWITTDWNIYKCLATFSQNKTALRTLKEEKEKYGPQKKRERDAPQRVGSPLAVNAPAIDRMIEQIGDRDGLCIYNEEMQNARVIHFSGTNAEGKGPRLLTPFYFFLYFENWRQDLWVKRIMRDHLRYTDEIQCAAARVVNAIRERAKRNDPHGNPEGRFDTFHVRRGDFTRWVATKGFMSSAEEIYESSKNELLKEGTVYIATNERCKDFFDPLEAHYDVVYLENFLYLLEDLDPNKFGLVEQLVLSKGRVFYGTWQSTLTTYVNRLRGYYVDKHKLGGHEDGSIQSYLWAPKDKKLLMYHYVPVKGLWFPWETALGWRDIDRGIEDVENHCHFG